MAAATVRAGDRRIELAHGTVGQGDGGHGQAILLRCEALSMALHGPRRNPLVQSTVIPPTIPSQS